MVTAVTSYPGLVVAMTPLPAGKGPYAGAAYCVTLATFGDVTFLHGNRRTGTVDIDGRQSVRRTAACQPSAGPRAGRMHRPAHSRRPSF